MSGPPSTPWSWHGGALAAAAAHFGADGPAWIDLSTGINPHPWPGAATLTPDWTRLPEADDLAALEAAAAARFGADPAHVCALPGTETGLRLLGALLPGPARYRAPSYRTHAAMLGGARPVDESALGADGAESRTADSLILANPNNPDGTLRPRAAMRALYDRVRAPGWLIVDEAFADATPQHSLAADVDDRRRLALFRSFGKFYGLPGLRLGFLIGPRPLLARMRAILGAWPVSAAALTLGPAAYRDEGWATAMRARLADEAAGLDALLARHGLRAAGSCPLFRLIETPDAPALFAHLARRHILTRPFDTAPHRLRLGLPADAAARDRLDAALTAFAAARGKGPAGNAGATGIPGGAHG